MAVAGSATTAYFVWLRDGKVAVDRTTCLNSECDEPADALEMVKRGERATVMGSDMVQFWGLMQAAGLYPYLK